jgi:hypothetical protein
MENYKDTVPMSKTQARNVKENFNFQAMHDKFMEYLDKYVPEFPKQVDIALPKLKKIELPKLKKVE